MSADRRKSPPQGDERPNAEGANDPRSGIPKLPAAFVGRRRFSVRQPEPEPEPDDPIAKAREWVDAQGFGLDEEGEDEALESDEPDWVVPEKPTSFLQSSGYVIDDDGSVPPAEEPTADDLPRLRVAGAEDQGSIELPRPRGGDWPTETPPHTGHARGADDSFESRPSIDDSSPAFDSFVEPSPSDEALGHTLAPRAAPAFRRAPPRTEPRPTLGEAGRFPLPDRPATDRETPESLRTHITPSPFVEDDEEVELEVAEVEVEESAVLDAEATQHRPMSVPVPRRPAIDHSIAPLDFGLDPSISSSSAPWTTPPPPSLGPSTPALAALGCAIGFFVLATVGALGIVYAFTTGV